MNVLHRSLVCLALLLFGFGQSFAQGTAVYTVTGTSTISSSGTIPSGATAAYTQTYSTFKQLTGGNSATLTLGGYAGYRITSIVLEMRSNASSGAGTLNVVAGSTNISSISPAVGFNNAAWRGSWSSSYVDVTKTPTAYSIAAGESVVITIAATANSLYIQKYSITYEVATPACTPPTTQATAAAFSAITNNSMNLSWTSGSGTGGRIVVMKEASAVAGSPTSGTSYTANSTFGSGGTIATGEYVVYNGTGNSVSVNGLKCGTAYHVKVYEYNTASTCYSTTSPATTNATTLSPSITASPTSLTGFTYVLGSGPSASQTYSLSASNLNPASGDITVTPSIATYEVSTNGTTFAPSVDVAYTAGTLASTPIYVRLKSGLAVNASYPATITNTYTAASGLNCPASASVTLSGSVTAPVPNIVLGSSNPAVAAGDIAMPSTNNVVYGFSLAVSVYQAVLSGVSITTGAGYAAGNLTNLKCWYSTDATFDSGDQLLSTKTTGLGPGLQTFPSFTSKTIASGVTGYIFITADVPCTTANNSITVSAVTTSNVTFTSGNKSGTAFAGGTKTFVDGTPNNVTAATTSNCVSGGSTVSWTLPSGCYDGILVFAKASGTFSGTPTGNGSLYTASTTFGLGTSFDSGFCVYKGTGSTVSISGLTNGVNYTFIIYTRLGLTWSAGVSVNCTPTIAYCTSSGNNSFATGIRRVQLNTINNATIVENNAYSDFTSISTTIDQGGTYNLSVNANTAGNYSVTSRVWFDWNQDGDFVDTGEEYELGTALNVTDGATSASPYALVVPMTATLGNTRMRVSVKYGAASTPCQTTFDGEVEDYTVIVASACVPTASISSFMPASGPAATLVTITGTGFTGATAVKFGTVAATSFTVVNATTIIAEVPAGVGASVQVSVSDASSCAATSSGTFSFVGLTGSCTIYATDLFISEVFDSESGNNHYIELHNFTGASVNLASPNQYNLIINGITNVNLTGTLAHGATLVVYCGTDNDGIANSAQNIGSGFNADDDLSLRKSGTVIDQVITPSYVGFTFIRHADVFAPSSTYNASEWDLTNHSISTSVPTLGSHTISAVSGPVVTSSPADVNACSLSMSVVSSTPGVTYQWKFNDPATMAGWLNVNTTNLPVVTISGANTATLTITGNVSSMLDFQFYCQVTESGCSIASNAAQYKYGSRPIYRSKASVNGNWSEPSNWEMSYDGSTFIDACVYPRSLNSSQAIIQSGTRVVLDLTTDEVDIDKLTIEANAELEMLPNARLTVYDSTASGADLIVNGTLIDRNNSANTIELSGNSTWILGTSGTIVRTNTAGIAQYKDQYQSGMSAIPATANWIFRYNGDGNPTVGSIDFFYPNLTFENTANAGLFAFNSGLMILSGSAGITTVKGNLNIGTTGTGQVSVHNNNTNASPLLIHGNATVASGSSLTNFATTAGTGFELKGSLTVNGTLDILSGATERVLRLTGTIDQAVSGTGTINLYKLTVNKASGNVLLNRDLKAQNELVMMHGHIYTHANLLELGLSTAQKGTLDYTANNYVVGKMRRWFDGTNSGNATGLFPMGHDESGLKNRHAKVEYTSAASAAGHLTVEFIGSPMGMAGLTILATNSGGFGSNVTTTENQGYWKIDNQTATLADGAYTISCTGQGFTTVNSLGGITLLKRVGGGNWLCPGAHIAATGSTAIPTVSRSGVAGWSNFGFGGDAANPLPVELLSFGADCSNGKVSIDWSTASEKNADYFIVQTSENMENWSEVSTVAAAGNSSQRLDYSAEDLNAQRGVSYYRLVQVDYNGDLKFYNPVSVNCSNEGSEFLTVYPNPSAGEFTVEWNKENLTGTVSITILSSSGALISERTLQASNGKQMVPFRENLAAGVYYIAVKGAHGSETLKLVVRQ